MNTIDLCYDIWQGATNKADKQWDLTDLASILILQASSTKLSPKMAKKNILYLTEG